jgi:hypothetical protein
MVNMAGQDTWQAIGGSVSVGLDGVNDYVDLGAMSRLSLTTAITMSAWIYPVSFAANRIRVLDSSGIGFKIGTNSPFSDVNAFVSANTVAETLTVNGVVSLNVWSHIAATWSSGDAISVFVNGSRPATAKGSTSASGSIVSTGILDLGRIASFSLYGNQQNDDVRIYNRVLTVAEIRLLASRRGIGLQAQTTRHASLPRKISLNVANTWKDCDCYINDPSGVPKLTTPSQNVFGVWK